MSEAHGFTTSSLQNCDRAPFTRWPPMAHITCRCGLAFRQVDTPIQCGFARHSEMLAPMTAKNTAITMMIALRPNTWIVAIARFEIIVCITRLSIGSTFETMWSYLCWPLSNEYHDPLSTDLCRNVDGVDPIMPTRSISIWTQH